MAIKWAAERWRLYLLAAPVKFRFNVRTDKLDEVGQIPRQVKKSVRRTVATANGGRKMVQGPPGGDHLSDAERARQDPYRASPAPTVWNQQDGTKNNWKEVFRASQHPYNDAPTDAPVEQLNPEQRKDVRQQPPAAQDGPNNLTPLA